MGSATTRYEKLTNNVRMVCGFGAAIFLTISSGTNFVSYMDDLLLASRCPIQDDIVLELKGMLEDWGLVVAPEKIQ